MVYHIDFHILKNPCTPRINPTWSCCISFLMYCWVLFAKILLKNFEFMFISDIGLFSSVQFSHSVVSDSLRPHESQHARPPCPSPTPGVHPNSCVSSRWCHPAFSSSVIPFSSYPQSLPASESFQWVSSSHEVAKDWSFSFSISPSNEHPGLVSFRMDWLDLLAVQGTHKSILHHHSSKASILQCSAFFTVQLLHPYMTTGEGNDKPLQYSCLENSMNNIGL